MKVAFFSTQPYEQQALMQQNKTHQLIFHQESLQEKTAFLAEGADAVCVFVNDSLDEACITELAKHHIRFIALRCAGYNQVDLKACRLHQIRVVRVPAYSPNAVAEHTMALLLTLVRKTHKAYNRVREGNFSLQGLEGVTLANKTIGIIGLGHIGQVFAKICLGFGCIVQAYDPQNIDFPGVKSVSFEQIIKTSDIISLHCPLTEQTHHLLGEQAFSEMKKGVILLNTGRGALMDSQALIHALKQQTVSAVGLDVYEQEAGLFFQDHSQHIISDDVLMRLTTFPNVLITSHQGFLTRESLAEIARTTIQNLNQLEASQPCMNELTSVS